MMGKILVKAPAQAVTQLGQGLTSMLSGPKTGMGQAFGGGLAGLAALNQLASASENQQDIFGGVGGAALAGQSALVAGGKAGDVFANTKPGQAISNKVGNTIDNTKQNVARYSRERDRTPSSQVGVQASRGQVERFKNQDFGANLPKDFQLGTYGTPMGGGNQSIVNISPNAPYTQSSVQPNLFSPGHTGSLGPHGELLTGQMQPPAGSSQLPTAGTLDANQTVPPIDSTAGNFGNVQGPAPPTDGIPRMSMADMSQVLPGVNGDYQVPPESQNLQVDSKEFGMPSVTTNSANLMPNVANLDANQIKELYASQNNVKNASEPFEIAFRLLKSVMS